MLNSGSDGLFRFALADAQAAKPEVKSARTTGGGLYSLLIIFSFTNFGSESLKGFTISNRGHRPRINQTENPSFSA